MCGLIAVKNREAAVDSQQVQNALHAIAHRGPDHSALWQSADTKTALGHARLSVIDLSGGNQPIVNRQHCITLVVNGELYEYQKIRQALQAKGYVFQTRTDSEIIIFLYREYGLNLFEHLRGEFSFILYDEAEDILLAGRDRFGIKPLCYYRDRHRLLIASEAKALFEFGIEKAWDEYNLMHAASMQYQPTHGTFFKNIHQLRPGHFLLLKDNQLRIKQYWDLDYPVEPVTPTRPDLAYIEEFHEHFAESVKLRLGSDVPVCFHLSGGLDSSAVAGLASRFLSGPAHCFTVSFSGKEAYDEAGLAEETARLIGGQLHRVEVSQDDIFAHLGDAVYFSEGLAVNGHITAKYLLNKAIRAAGFKVALTGEGADEVLAGYDHLRQDIVNQQAGDEKERSLSELYAANLVSVGTHLAHGETLNVEALEKRLGYVPAFLRAKASLGHKIHAVLSDDVLQRYQQADFFQDLLASYNVQAQLQGRHVVHQSSYLWTKLTLANYILKTLGDGCEMASSVEGRLPFLDHKLFEFARNLPMHLKIHNGLEKHILREAAKPYLSEAVYKRQKHPFTAPPITLFHTRQNMDFIRDTLRSRDFKAMNFYDAKKVSHLLDRLDTMETVELTAYEPVIMFMLTSTLFHQQFGLTR